MKCNFTNCECDAVYVTGNPLRPGEKKFACEDHHRGMMWFTRGRGIGMNLAPLPATSYPTTEQILAKMRAIPMLELKNGK